jgi:hypothetical protein
MGMHTEAFKREGLRTIRAAKSLSHTDLRDSFGVESFAHRERLIDAFQSFGKTAQTSLQGLAPKGENFRLQTLLRQADAQIALLKKLGLERLELPLMQHKVVGWHDLERLSSRQAKKIGLSDADYKALQAAVQAAGPNGPALPNPYAVGDVAPPDAKEGGGLTRSGSNSGNIAAAADKDSSRHSSSSGGGGGGGVASAAADPQPCGSGGGAGSSSGSTGGSNGGSAGGTPSSNAAGAALALEVPAPAGDSVAQGGDGVSPRSRRATIRFADQVEWGCSVCGATNPAGEQGGAQRCSRCAAARPSKVIRGFERVLKLERCTAWRCAICRTVNAYDQLFCALCNARRTAENELVSAEYLVGDRVKVVVEKTDIVLAKGTAGVVIGVDGAKAEVEVRFDDGHCLTLGMDDIRKVASVGAIQRISTLVSALPSLRSPRRGR